jgi:hypothetical protein
VDDLFITDHINWPVFMARHDLVWEQLPRQWNEGAFVGNGQLGMMLYASLSDNRIDFHLGRADVTDHRKAPDRKTSMGADGANVMFDFPRLDIGRMVLRPVGKILAGTMRQDLWNAEITATIETDRGELSLRALTPHDRMVHIIDVASTEKDSTGAPAPWKWEFLPGKADSPRALVFPEMAREARYAPNPEPIIQRMDDVAVCVQQLLAGGDFATAWLEIKTESIRSARMVISTANKVPVLGQSAGVAVADVLETAAESGDYVVDAHRSWWHNYYPQSFLSIPDPRMESFYWIQMYKLGSAWREDGPPIDLFGPWFRISQWPGIWWNLNIQLTYWPVYAGNRLDIGRNYMDLVDRQFDTTFASSFLEPTIGDFAWALHNYWWQLRFAGDWHGVKDRWMPKAKRMAFAYMGHPKRDASGKLELPQMGSPEYNGFQPYDNTNYNLGLLRWLLNTLIEASGMAGQGVNQEVAEWKLVLKDLVDYPCDSNGLMIGSDQAIDQSHRHFSHLLPYYPLYQLDTDDPANRELILRTVNHWHRIEDGRALTGFSFSGGAAIYASLGLGTEACGMLNDFLDNARGTGLVLPNTMYVESGGRNPVIETPLSAASAIMDLLLQSWNGKIRIFPAVPSAWNNVVFHRMRAMDGFVVSAKREGGKTSWVTVHSEAGLPCMIKVTDWEGQPFVKGRRSFSVVEGTQGEYQIDLKKGEEILLSQSEAQDFMVVRELPSESKNPYGVKRGKQLEEKQFWPEKNTGF